MMHRFGRELAKRRLWRHACAAVIAVAALASTLGIEASSAQEADAVAIDRVLASLSVDERVGQLVMVNFVGDDVSESSDIAALIRDFKVGAVLVTASNGNVVNRGDTARQLAELTNGLQETAFASNRRSDAGSEYFVPLFIATDNEGDLFPFTNVTNGFTTVPNNMTIGATWSKQHAQTTGRIIGGELSAAGINMLLGPVVDVLDNPRSGGSGDIGIRSFGGQATWVGALARAFVRGVHEGSEGRMLTVAKHFPGHGGSDRSTDNEVPTINKSLGQLRAAELAPFAEVNREDAADPLGTVDAMMVSHIRYRAFQPSAPAPFTRPISLDASAQQTLMDLPEFAGWRANHLVMADSLGVPAVKQWYARDEGAPEFPNRTVVREALLAGNDLLPLIEFYRNPDERGWRDYQLPVIQDSIIYMREQYQSDPDFRRRADEAVRHVIAAKMKLYPALQRTDVLNAPERASAAVGLGGEEMRALAESALTLVHPPTIGELRARLPRGPVAPDRVLIVECWDDCYPYRVMPSLDLQNALLRLYGPDGQARLDAGDVSTISFGDLDAWLAAPSDPANDATAAAVSDATWVIFALTEYNPEGRPASGAVKRFLDATPVDLRNKNLVAIAYNVPYHLDSTEISKLSAYFVVYNKTSYAIDAGFRALFGDIAPQGHSPVNISGVFYRVEDATQPDPEQQLAVSVFGHDADAVPSGETIGLVAGPVLDRNGNPVPDGATVLFTLEHTGGTSTTASGKTVDGMAGAQLDTDGAGDYIARASIAGIAADPLAVHLVAGAVPPTAEPPNPPAAAANTDGGTSPLLLALVIGAPAAVVLGVAGAGGVLYVRRRRQTDETPFAAPVAALPVAPSEPAVERALRVDADTRRVYVKGVEAKPPLSNEQFRLLLYLFERAGNVVGREELVRHVWPDVHAEGVSEEALDALVRRVRERIVQAGGERTYIVTLRGQGFRLEV